VFLLSDGRLIAYWWGGKVIEIVDLEKSRVVGVLSHPGPIDSPVWRSDGKLLAVPCDPVIHIWNLQPGRS